jgi:hypothetical protein
LAPRFVLPDKTRITSSSSLLSPTESAKQALPKSTLKTLHDIPENRKKLCRNLSHLSHERKSMLNIFNQIANLASGTLAIAAAVTNAAPQVSAENHKQATLDLTGVALQAAAKVVTVGTGNVWVLLGAQLLPAIYDEVMTVVNKHGMLAAAVASQNAAAAPAAAK